ncbi:acetyltransferase [Arenicella chitinivorans]|uniref:Acetyltransferase n=1 Tax=Arenicella chitinivorans TaxID=1329800 RepID=A0A918VRF3_9GAMM|nr:alpha/beta hydrolase [Arenicella chitinivorans]GHA18591.1 acetyltransferase [Arenicella chitinivorans]
MDAQRLPTNVPSESVILLHGLGRTRFAMRKIAAELSNEFHVVNQGYPSRSHPIETLADLAIESALAACADASRVHFVTHSLGGILVRQYLSRHALPQLGHVVMLGPPNQGSEIVEAFRRTPILTQFFDLLNGPAGRQLGTSSDSRPRSLGAVDFSLGVIAGNRSVDPVLSRLLPSQSDGKVTVESSRVDGMQDHIVLPVDHTFMMRDPRVIKQIQTFLRQGRFKHHD